MKPRKTESKEAQAKEVHSLVKGGMKVPAACKKAGINFTTYYKWVKKWNSPVAEKRKKIDAQVKKTRRKKTIKVPLPEEPTASRGKVVVLIGSIDDVAEAIRRFS